jgi:LysM repeat protein
MKKTLYALGLSLTLSLPFYSFAQEDLPRDYEILGFYGTLEPKPIFNPTKINFGTVEVGKEKTERIRIANKGYGYLYFKKIYLENGTAFTLKKIDCPGFLSYGQSCSITVAFKPPKSGTYVDSIIVVTNADERPIYKIELTGKGTGGINTYPRWVYSCPTTQTPIENNYSVETVKPVKDNAKTVIVFETPPQVYQENNFEEIKETVHKKVERKSQVDTEEIKTSPVKKPTFTTYVVKPCDTLWDLSYKFYKTPLLWAAIYEANKDKIRDPWIIKAGTVLKIPINLMPEQIKKYKRETIKLMEEMADRPLGPKCPLR